jgi:aryl-alcohol dehydrogenase-like predicted oxidoreductase
MFAVRTSLSDPERLKLDIKRMIEARQADSELVKLDKTIDFLVESGYAESIMEAAYRFCRHTEGIDMTLTGTSSVSHLADNLSSILKPELPQDVLNILENMFGRVDCVSGE